MCAAERSHHGQQVLKRRAAGAGGRLRLLLPLGRPPPHLLALHGLPDVRGDLLPPHLRVQPDADAPHLAGVLAVGVLVREPRPAHHRHAGGHALARRVPPAMRQEAAHGRVTQHLLLRAPRRHVAPPRRRSPEVRGQHGRAAAAAADEVVPDAP